MDVGQNISAANGMWSFGNNVADNFVEHANLSIPLYKLGHELVCDLSEFFVAQNSICYEIGSSTGELTKKLGERNSHKNNIKIIGIESEANMVEKAKQNCKNINSVEFQNANVIDFAFEPTDFLVSYYCVQFIKPSVRQLIIDKIYKSLNWGGAFLLFEKVRGPDARFQDISNIWYNSFKIKNGFTPSEVISKTESLKTVLEPFSTQGNLDMLQRAGFKDISSIMKYMCFEGFLAIK